MKEGRTIFNMKNEDLVRTLSQKLLIAFNESKYRLEYQFICLRCLGISVNPLYCRHCKYSYCGTCIQLLPASKIICICRKTSKENFEFQINQELFNTRYFIQDKSSLQISQRSYSELLTWHNESPYIFIPSENDRPRIELFKTNNKNCHDINLKVSRHQTNCLHQFSLKEARLINFNYEKGYPLKLRDKVICANDGNFLRIIHLAKIELEWIYWSIAFSFSLSKAIRSNKNKLKEIRVFYHGEKINLKSYLILFNALRFCSKLEFIDLELNCQYLKEKLIPKSFYEFLSNSYILKEITFNEFFFYDYMNFKSFQRLVSLQILSLRYCTFNFNSFEYMYHNNFPKLQTLYLMENKITKSFSGENIALANPFLHKALKFPSILVFYYLIDSSYSLENLLFDSLIKSESVKLKSLRIWFGDDWNSKPIPTFFKFLNVSNIQFLSLEPLLNSQGFDSEDFCEFLRNSKFIKGLKLRYSKKDGFNAGLILHALSLNKSIKVLYLDQMYLSNCYLDLIHLILSNQVITFLSLTVVHIKINVDLINALSKSKSVLYLYLESTQINNDDAVKLSELTLKGINVDFTGIGESKEVMIYKKIPKFYAPNDIHECEKFLKEKKDN